MTARRRMPGADQSYRRACESRPPRVDAPERGVEQLHRMQRRKPPARAVEGLRDLDEATRVRARERVRLRREDVRGLAVAELPRCVRLHDVVDPGRPAAEILLCRLDDSQARDALEERAPRRRQPLGVTEMARVLVREA